MRIAWGLVAVAVLGCGDKKQDHSPIIREVDLDKGDPWLDVKPTDPVRAPTAVVDDTVPSEPAPVDPPPAAAECVDHGKITSWDPAKQRACFDGDDDGT